MLPELKARSESGLAQRKEVMAKRRGVVLPPIQTHHSSRGFKYLSLFFSALELLNTGCVVYSTVDVSN